MSAGHTLCCTLSGLTDGCELTPEEQSLVDFAAARAGNTSLEVALRETYLLATLKGVNWERVKRHAAEAFEEALVK